MGIGYKLFIKKNDKLFPLYVNATEETPMLKWLPAECGERDDKGKVKSKLGGLAYRPGWHLNEDAPYVSHIYTMHDGVKCMKDNAVWCLVEYSDSINYQEEANRIGTNKKGIVIPKMSQLPYIPFDGYYRYKTSPNMTGSWIISGAIKVVRELNDEEVVKICHEHGYEPFPRYRKERAA